MGARSSQSRGPGLNETDGHLLEYFRNTFGGGGGGTNYVAPPGSGLTATGGVISDYTTAPGDVYRAHIFTSSGALNVTELGTFDNAVEYLVVAGGGSGPHNNGGGAGGGGAGGYRSSVVGESSGGGGSAESVLPVSVSSYPVVIGAGAAASSANIGNQGGPSTFGPIVSTGGGAGNCSDPAPNSNGGSGGSGGGGGEFEGSQGVAGTGTANQGYPGGTGRTPNSVTAAAGGGGAGAAGGDGNQANGTTAARTGGIGVQSNITGTATYYAGGGGASGNGVTGGNGGLGGGGGAGTGSGGSDSPNGYASGSPGTGGGGGARYQSPSAFAGGGSGIVVVRYKIGSITATAKATGGAISFYNGKTIHAFTSTGPFVTPGSFSETCEYVVVGGGGGGFTGGGGAGGYRTGTTPIGNSVSYTITVGGGSNAKSPIGSPSSIGTIPISIPGGGSSRSGPEGSGRPGASGGGGVQGGGGSTGASATGAPYPGSIGATPSSGWGHAGGNGQPADKTGGGGGGAGGAGNPNSTGGTGIQLPTTFRDPNGFKYDNHPDHPFRPSATAGYFVAGGGAGTVYTPFPQASPPLGPTPYSASATGVGGVGGGGSRNPADPRVPVYGFNGMANTGGGGAGGTPANPVGALGGSGIVLIAYPT